GGPWGFAELMRALHDDKHPEHEMYSRWMEQIGEIGYDPAHCDLDEINKALSQLSVVALQH
ncbi:MAG: IS1096 element passenger TnpR family protein, partial [Pseudonocardiaceae bacterium]